MKFFRILTMSLALLGAGLTGVSAKSLVDRVDPPHWWAGMENLSLQLMFYGSDIRFAEVALDYPGVSVDSIVRLDSPNYLFVYLNVSKEAKPGNLEFNFKLGKKKETYSYELKKREIADSERRGFDSSDVLYLIMPDRFAKGSDTSVTGARQLRNPTTDDRDNPSGRHGGDIAGMRAHLDYVNSLGVTAVWVNPVLENDMPGGSYHGYATTDYYRIDPRFGSNAEWSEFISDAHSRGIKVVMDMIFNHCGVEHPWLSDKPSNDWINFPDEYVQTNHRLTTIFDPYASEYDHKKAVDGWFVPSMPDLNQRNPHLMTYLIQNSIWWIEESGIDGIRMDTHPYADLDGMARWLMAVEKEYPGYNIVGECWYNSEGAEAFWQKNSYVSHGKNTQLPTVMDFAFCVNSREAFSQPTTNRGGLNKIYDHLALDYLFPDPSHIMTFLDNHDTDRFLLEIPDNLGWWKQAVAFLLTSRGIPQIYYGTEILMHGSKADGDGYIRLDMPGGFPGDKASVFSREGRSEQQNEAYDFMSKILHYRRGNDAISKGSLKHFAPDSGLYTYERKHGDRRVVVIMNGTDGELTVAMDQTAEVLPFGSKMRDVLTDEVITVEPTMTFAPRALYILEDVK